MKNYKLTMPHDISCLLTYLSVLSACLGICFVCTDVLPPPKACIFLTICGFFDGLDGKFARQFRTDTRDQAVRFGAEIDSIADVIAFGLFPAILMLKSTEKVFLSFSVFFFFVLCCAIRLAWFGATEQEEWHDHFFYGIASTYSAFIIPIAFLMIRLFDFTPDIVLSSVMFITGLSFVLNVKMPRPTMKIITVYGAISLCASILLW